MPEIRLAILNGSLRVEAVVERANAISTGFYRSKRRKRRFGFCPSPFPLFASVRTSFGCREQTSLILHAPWAAQSYHSLKKPRRACGNLLVQPGTRVSPFTLCGGHGDAENLRGFLERE